MKNDYRSEFKDALGALLETTRKQSLHGMLRYTRERSVSMHQLAALMSLDYEGGCRMVDLANRMGISNAAASQMFERLVQNGLVSRTENREDRRAKTLDLTSLGEEIVQHAVEYRTMWFDRFADALSPDERRSAAAALTLLTERMPALGESNE